MSGGLNERQLSFGITEIHCNGSEDNITSCLHSTAQLHSCQSHEDAGAVCHGNYVTVSDMIAIDVIFM